MGKRRERALMVALTDVLEAFSAAHSDNCDYEGQDDDDEEECMWCRGASHAQDTLNRVRRELDRQAAELVPTVDTLYDEPAEGETR